MLIVVTLVILLLAAFPTGMTGRALRELLVERPARQLNRLSPGRIAFYGALGLAGAGLFWLFEAEGIRLFAFAAPDLIVWFTMFDVSVFVDALILAAALATKVRVRVIVTAVAGGLRRVPGRLRARLRGRETSDRARKPRGGRRSDEPDPAGLAFA